MPKLKLTVEELVLEIFRADDDPARDGRNAPAMAIRDTQQFRCTYFCTYSACTGLPC